MSGALRTASNWLFGKPKKAPDVPVTRMQISDQFESIHNKNKKREAEKKRFATSYTTPGQRMTNLGQGGGVGGAAKTRGGLLG